MKLMRSPFRFSIMLLLPFQAMLRALWQPEMLKITRDQTDSWSWKNDVRQAGGDKVSREEAAGNG